MALKSSAQAGSVDRFPIYLIVLCGLTAAYLAIEVPFAAFLVDLLGANPDKAALERAEQCGRIVSGLALALALWSFQIPALLRRGRPALAIGLSCLVSACLVVPLTYTGEKSLIDLIAENSSADFRQQATRSLAAREVFFHPGAQIAGLELDPSNADDPSWSAFRGLFGFITILDDDLLAKVSSTEVDLMRAAIERAMPDETGFPDLVSRLIDGYRLKFKAYEQVLAARQQALEALRSRIETAWSAHLRNMERERVIGENANNYGQIYGVRTVVKVVRHRGVNVPEGWDPRDKDTFVRVIAGDYLPAIDEQFASASRAIFGRVMSSAGSASFDAFLVDTEVQQALAADLGIATRLPVSIDENMTQAELAQLFRLHESGFGAELREAYSGPSSPFANGGKFESIGEDAVRAVVVPVMALGLSVLGAVGHSIKLLNYLMVLLLRLKPSRLGISRRLSVNGFLRLPLLLGSLATVATSTYAPATEITETTLYKDSVRALRDELGQPVELGLEWTISLQRWIAPTSRLVRQTGLFEPIAAYLNGSSAELSVQTDTGIPLPRPRPKT